MPPVDVVSSESVGADPQTEGANLIATTEAGSETATALSVCRHFTGYVRPALPTLTVGGLSMGFMNPLNAYRPTTWTVTEVATVLPSESVPVRVTV